LLEASFKKNQGAGDFLNDALPGGNREAMTTRLRASTWLLTLICACAGKAETPNQQQGDQTASAQNQKVCDELADSGVDLVRCEALSCCKELLDCNNNPDGTAFNNCVLNCLIDPAHDSSADGTACSQACVAAHPSGYSACSPTTECISRACTMQ
jgi:hypothetical protein